jgi:UDP-N-acetylmuramate--alanine ligase
VSGALIADAIRATGHPRVDFIPTKDAVVAHLRGVLQPGDMLLTLGAGDIWKVGAALQPAAQDALR